METVVATETAEEDTNQGSMVTEALHKEESTLEVEVTGVMIDEMTEEKTEETDEMTVEDQKMESLYSLGDYRFPQLKMDLKTFARKIKSTTEESKY